MKRISGWLSVVMCVVLLSVSMAAGAIHREEVSVLTDDGVSIHVLHKFRPGGRRKAPVLLVHGTWGNSSVWDIPERSVMNDLAERGYDVYALDLRGMGQSDRPANYATIGLLDRVRDVTAVASYIVTTTGRRPVVMGHSQGGLLTGLLAASSPYLVQAVGLLSIPADGFYVPQELQPLMASVVASGVDRYLPDPGVLYAIGFGRDPVTGRPTIGTQAFGQFLAKTEPDSVRVILEELSPDFFGAVIAPIWPTITVPALVVDGAQDLVVGEARARALYEALGSKQKDLVILPRNAHTWFLDDNFHATMRVFDAFLARVSNPSSK